MKPGEKFYAIKVDQPGPTLYVHPCYGPYDDAGYQVLDQINGAALWRDEASAILFIRGLGKTMPGRKFKLELLDRKIFGT